MVGKFLGCNGSGDPPVSHIHFGQKKVYTGYIPYGTPMRRAQIRDRGI